MKDLIKEIKFQNGINYLLIPEERKNLIKKCGCYFPNGIFKENKTLVELGLSGTGKSTIVKSLCKSEGIPYRRDQALIVLENGFPLYKKFPFLPIYNDFNSLFDLSKFKIIDAHFLFNYPNLGNKPLFPHSRKVRKSNIYDLSLNNNLSLPNSFILEFRQFSPQTIIHFRNKRVKKEKRMDLKFSEKHYRNCESPEQITKGQYVLYQAAHCLYENGANVYVRTSPKGMPLRFVK